MLFKEKTKLKIYLQRKRYLQARQHFPELEPEIINLFFANFGYTMPLSLLVKLKSLCNATACKFVVEFGSGLSTLVLSNAISPNGFVISFEENIEWLSNTSKLLNDQNRSISLICLPSSQGMNYDLVLRYLSFPNKPELVVIDGPSKGDRFSPCALDVYHKLLSPNCICVIDDTDRRENNVGATNLAGDFSLRKIDYGDPIYTNHQYSILMPENIREF
ncbi:MAG: hypothetical protein AB1510_02935 [Bacillota bacterium]